MTRHLCALAAFLGLLLCGTVASAAETKLEVTLVWGTNDAKSPDPDHKDLEGDLAERLKKVFQWKNYFLVNRKKGSVKHDGAVAKFQLSDKAVVEIKALADSKYEIRLIGKDNLVVTRTEVIKKADVVALAGDVKNTDCAWFILIRQK